MSLNRINPYLMLPGTGEQAIRLYEKALGAKAAPVMRYGDVPGMECPEGNKGLIIHALLRVGENVFMLSDSTPDHPVPAGDNVQIALDYSDPAEMSEVFNALSEGGTVIAPISDTFWGAKFGIVKDAFGISWMFNCEIKKQGA